MKNSINPTEKFQDPGQSRIRSDQFNLSEDDSHFFATATKNNKNKLSPERGERRRFVGQLPENLESKQVSWTLPKSHPKATFGQTQGYPQRVKVIPEYSEYFAQRDDYHPDYHPEVYTDPEVIKRDITNKPAGATGKEDWWADPTDPIEAMKLHGPRSSYEVKIDKQGRPVNPVGLTGIAGRGSLGDWGANLAADPMVTRVNPDTDKLELLVIQRKDNGEWALPGGFADPDDANASVTAKRELGEEAGVTEMNGDKLDFENAPVVYRGYVDDPRNTDHAWMETTAVHVHLNENQARNTKLKAGDDAKAAKWLSVDLKNLDQLKLYASHKDIVEKMLRMQFPDRC